MSYPMKSILITFTVLPEVLPEKGKYAPVRIFCTVCTACTINYMGKWDVCGVHKKLNILGVQEVELIPRQGTLSIPPEEKAPSPPVASLPVQEEPSL